VSADPLPERFARYVAQLRAAQPRMAWYPDLTARPWWEAAAIPLAQDLERNAAAIGAEFHALPPVLFHAEAEPIRRAGGWDVCMLYERGQKHEETCARCPVTTAVIERNRTVRDLAGLAYFSRLAPGSRVEPHRGPTNLRLRCHVGIDVPAGCGIRVGGEARRWSEGRCIVFDDSFEHEVWNESARERIVLIVDLWHPDLSDDEVALLEGLYAFAETAGGNLAAYRRANERVRGTTGAAGGTSTSA
jgi:aspartate beta-hydroxylase